MIHFGNTDVQEKVDALLDALGDPDFRPSKTFDPPEGTSTSFDKTAIPAGSSPLPELTTQYFFPRAFPSVWPKAMGCFCGLHFRSMTFTQWCEHACWWKDGRVQRHPFLKFVMLSIKQKQAALASSRYYLKKNESKLPEAGEVLERLRNGDKTIYKDVMDLTLDVYVFWSIN